MIAAKHFFCLFAFQRARPVRTAQLSAAFRRMGYQAVEQSCLLGFVPFGPEDAFGQQQSLILHVMPGTEVRIRSELSSLNDRESATTFAYDIVRLFNLISISLEKDLITILSDRLSLLPCYTARVDGGMLVCSSVRHMFAACPELSQELDGQGVFEFLCCGTAFGAHGARGRSAIKRGSGNSMEKTRGRKNRPQWEDKNPSRKSSDRSVRCGR